MSFVFFFQAEDGIRDYKVTGVQTCALPIYHVFTVGTEIVGHVQIVGSIGRSSNGVRTPWTKDGVSTLGRIGRPSAAVEDRSEERRVGKEWRGRREREEQKKKKGAR